MKRRTFFGRVVMVTGAANGVACRTPAGRLATPEEIVRAIAFLALDEASFVTGITIPIDGGYSAFGGAFDASGSTSPFAEALQVGS